MSPGWSVSRATLSPFEHRQHPLGDGPLNDVHQLERVSAAVDGIGEHATVLTGGERVGAEGFFYAPTAARPSWTSAACG